jgi:hypothetical protein
VTEYAALKWALYKERNSGCERGLHIHLLFPYFRCLAQDVPTPIICTTLSTICFLFTLQTKVAHYSETSVNMSDYTALYLSTQNLQSKVNILYKDAKLHILRS